MRIEETNQIMKDAKTRQVEVEAEGTDFAARVRQFGTRVRNDGGEWLKKNRGIVGSVTGALVAATAATTLLMKRRRNYKWYDPRRLG